MSNPTGPAAPARPDLVHLALLISALACGVTGLAFLPSHVTVGLALCTIALADLGLFRILRRRHARRSEAVPST